MKTLALKTAAFGLVLLLCSCSRGSPGVLGSDGDEAFLVRTACRDFQGNPSKAMWIQPNPPYLPCHNNPLWQEFLKKRSLDHVRGEADTLDIDEVGGSGDTCTRSVQGDPVRGSASGA